MARGLGMVRAMRILDRYLLRLFIAPFFYCLAAFWLLVSLYDLLGDKADDFLQSHVAWAMVARYYYLATPSFLTPMIPLAILLALLYSLSLLSKQSELNAMRASGLALRRAVLPLLVFGGLASVGVYWLSETLVPAANAAAKNLLTEVTTKPQKNEEVLLSLHVNQTHRYWQGKFNRHTGAMADLELTQFQASSTAEPLEIIRAKRAQWLDQEWWFFDGAVSDYAKAQFGVPHLEVFQTLRRADLTETPQFLLLEIERSKAASRAAEMSIADLKEYLNYFPQDSPDNADPERQHTLAQFRTRLHQRYAQSFGCLLVMLVGIPLGSRFNRRGPLMATALALGLLFCFQFAVQVMLPLGFSNTMAPWMAAWLPYGIFGGIGLWLFARME